MPLWLICTGLVGKQDDLKYNHTNQDKYTRFKWMIYFLLCCNYSTIMFLGLYIYWSNLVSPESIYSSHISGICQVQSIQCSTSKLFIKSKCLPYNTYIMVIKSHIFCIHIHLAFHRWSLATASDASFCSPLCSARLHQSFLKPASGPLQTAHGPRPEPARWEVYQNQADRPTYAGPLGGPQWKPHARRAPRLRITFPRPGGQLPVWGSAIDKASPSG